MTWVVRVLPDAELEFEASARWYDERAGLRTEFVEAIDEAVYSIAEEPLRYQLWRPNLPYRRCIVRRFPYLVFYRVRTNHIEIVAFAHGRRKPGYWSMRTT